MINTLTIWLIFHGAWDSGSSAGFEEQNKTALNPWICHCCQMIVIHTIDNIQFQCSVQDGGEEKSLSPALFCLNHNLDLSPNFKEYSTDLVMHLCYCSIAGKIL